MTADEVWIEDVLSGHIRSESAVEHVKNVRLFRNAAWDDKNPGLAQALDRALLDPEWEDLTRPDVEPCPICGHPQWDKCGCGNDEELTELWNERHPLDPFAGTALEGMRDGDWLEAYEPPPLEFHLPGIIPEGLTLFVGPPKIGKSWFFLSLSLAIACGGQALGLTVEKRPVLYLALEDGDRRMKDRCRKLLEPGTRIPREFRFKCTMNADVLYKAIEQFLVLHPDKRPLVLLDTLGKVMPSAMPGEGTYNRDYRIGTMLKRAIDARPGASLTVAHHDRKAESDDFVDKVSGSNGLAGAADTIIILQRKRGEKVGLLQVTGRDVSEGEYAVELLDGTTWQLQGQSLQAALEAAARHRVTAGVGDRMVEIIEWVSKQTHPVSGGEVAAALDLADDVAGRYLRRAVDAGRLVRPRRGLYTCVRSVRNEEDAQVTGPFRNGHPSGGVSVSPDRRGQANNQTDTSDTSDTPPGGDADAGRPALADLPCTRCGTVGRSGITGLCPSCAHPQEANP